MTKGLLVADLHCGHVLGLTPPDYWQGRCRGLQRGLWEWWAAEVKAIGPVDFAIFDGDLVDGPGRKETIGLWTTDSEEQADAASEALSIVKARERYICYGCLTAGHRILTADLRHVPVESLKPGDALLAFSENRDPKTHRRNWQLSIVQDNSTAIADVYKIHLSDGTSIEATYDHPFLVDLNDTGYTWATVEMLEKRIAQERQTFLTRFLNPWESPDTHDHGYLAGFFDGEGNLSQRHKQCRGHGNEHHLVLQAYQNEGVALNAVTAVLSRVGYPFRVYEYDKGKPCRAIRIMGGTHNVLRFLGEVRPARLLSKLDVDKLRTMRCAHTKAEILDIEPMGKKTIYQLRTSSKTYIADGFPCHNTPFHTVTSLSIENLIARKLGAEIRDTLRLKVQGKGWEVRFNARHVQGRSDIPTGQGAQTGKEIIREMLQAMIEDYRPADILARAHTHYWFRIEIAGRTAISIPSMMLPDPDRGRSIYARRLRTMYYDVGFVYIEIDRQGEVYIRPRRMSLKVLVPKEYLCLKAVES